MTRKFIIGLGNPGSEYKETRHNIGFALLDSLAELFSSEGKLSNMKQPSKLKSSLVEFPADNLILVYPQTYMNLSGQAVRAIADWYKVSDLKNLLIVHDDVALPLGQIKLIDGGGAGGQHGVESIFEHFGGSKNFRRLKFGVGPDPGGERRASYVLGKFREDELELLNETRQRAVEALQGFSKGQVFDKLMAEFNMKSQKSNSKAV